MERPGITLEGVIPTYVYVASEGAAWGGAIGLVVTQGFTQVTFGMALLGAVLGFAIARWYLPRVRGEET